MTDILALSEEVLREAGFAIRKISVAGRPAIAFENPTSLGFVFAYDTPSEILATWSQDADTAVSAHQLVLRRARQKAWNAYAVFLAREAADYVAAAALSAIEEDLVGTRKIARAGVLDSADVRAALLPLLPLQSAPLLQAVDFVEEIRQRTTELPSRAVDAFLSSADDSVVIQVFEEPS